MHLLSLTYETCYPILILSIQFFFCLNFTSFYSIKELNSSIGIIQSQIQSDFVRNEKLLKFDTQNERKKNQNLTEEIIWSKDAHFPRFIVKKSIIIILYKSHPSRI